MPNAKELLKQAAERIEEQAAEIETLRSTLSQYEEANSMLGFEVDLMKKAFALVEYGIEPGYDTYNEALDKAASFEETHGTSALSMNKQASMPAHSSAPSLGKAASSTQALRGSNNAEQKFLDGMISIVNQEE